MVVTDISKNKEDQSPWNMLTNDSIFNRTNFACGVFKDRFLVVAGGWCSSEALRSAAMYDVMQSKNLSYIELPNLPLSGDCKGAVLHGSFYVIFPGRSMYCISLLQSSSIEFEWKKVQNDKMHKINDIDAMVSDEKYLYIFSWTEFELYDGYNYPIYSHESSFMRIYCYSPLSDIIFEMPTLSTARSKAAPVVMNEQIYIMMDDSNAMQHLDCNNSSWRQIQLASSHADFIHSSVVVCKNRWIVIFQISSRTSSSMILTYDTLHQKWTDNHHKLSPENLSSHCSVTCGSHIIFIVGFDNDYRGWSIQSIHAKYIIPDYNWESTKEYVLLRQLVNDNRAHPIIQTKPSQKSDIYSKLDVDKVIQGIFTADITLDLFRKVLSFIM